MQDMKDSMPSVDDARETVELLKTLPRDIRLMMLGQALAYKAMAGNALLTTAKQETEIA